MRALVRLLPLCVALSLLAACATFGAKPTCASCGTLLSVEASAATRAANSGGGVVLGGIVGGVAAAPQAPAPQKAPAATVYDLRVRMDDGRVVVVHQTEVSGLRRNAPVRVINGKVVAATTVTAKP